MSRRAEAFSQRRPFFLLLGVCLFCVLSVRAVLVGGAGAAGVRLLAVLAGGHPLVDPVQTASLLEVPDLPRGGETLDGCRERREGV